MLRVLERCGRVCLKLLNQPHPTPCLVTTRHIGFFTNQTADQLWKSVTTVSNAGRKRGRARGLMRRRDLNRGQAIGVGRDRVLWPGLLTDAVRANRVTSIKKLEADPERQEKLLRLRQAQTARQALRLTPLERGWSGRSMPGRSMGPMQPIDHEPLDNLDSVCLELKPVTNMTAVAGRVKHVMCLGVVGNGRGLIGLGLSNANSGPAAITKCRQRAARKLLFVERMDEHTVLHNFFTRFINTKIFVERRPRGYGLRCHRVIAAICRLVGISDLQAVVEGSCNPSTVAKAFVLGLLRQKSHEQLANEKRLHVVELAHGSEEAGVFCPRLLASPTLNDDDGQGGGARRDCQVPADESTDFDLHIYDGKVPVRRPKPPPPYVHLESFDKHLRKVRYRRNHDQVRLRLLAEYGELRSFLADEYPECRASWHCRNTKEESEEDEEDY